MRVHCKDNAILIKSQVRKEKYLKKLSNGEKFWKQMMYRYRQLKKIGVLRNEHGQQMTFKEFRGSQFNKTITKDVTIQTKKGKKVTRKIVKFVPLSAFRETVEKEPKHKQAISKAERRKLRAMIRHACLVATQKMVAANKERRKVHKEARRSNE